MSTPVPAWWKTTTKAELIAANLANQVARDLRNYRSAVTRASRPKVGAGTYRNPRLVETAEDKLVRGVRQAARHALAYVRQVEPGTEAAVVTCCDCRKEVYDADTVELPSGEILCYACM